MGVGSHLWTIALLPVMANSVVAIAVRTAAKTTAAEIQGRPDDFPSAH
jgi:hypothetical protein